MKRLISLFLILLLLPVSAPAQGLFSWLTAAGTITVGADIAFEDITDFYYTTSSSTYPPHYQRYRFYVEDGRRYFYHETRDGGGWPQTEEDITVSGTALVTEAQWAVFCELIGGGTAKKREESIIDGDDGPWMYIYWPGGEKDGREFTFGSYGQRLEFEAFCASLVTEKPMFISVTDGTHTIVYRLNNSPSSRALYMMLPMDAPVEDYGDNEKIFYPTQAITAEGGIEGGGMEGTLALFSPWGNVVMYYDAFSAYPGLYILGKAIEGIDQVEGLQGSVHIEAVER